MKLAFLWHMHQPFYKDLVSGRYEMPWVRLHGLKDYYDMAAILENYPSVKQTFNVVPSLLEQLEEYGRGEAVDTHLALSKKPADKLTDSEKAVILSEFFKANHDTMIAPYARYEELYRKRFQGISAFAESDWRDLQVWSNLSWVDPLFRTEPLIKSLFSKGRDFSEQDKISLLGFEAEIIRKIIPIYKKLALKGQIELSVSPYFHPILPLLCDTESARIARPGMQLPANRFRYPEDARLQVRMAIDYFNERFGFYPKGMWPSEGSVSEEIIPILADSGISWIATDEEILAKSIGRGLRQVGDNSLINSGDLYRMYAITVNGKSLNIFFRDHALSDLIGFVYSRMPADDAAADFIARLEAIEANLNKKGKGDAVVSIILDGENAWEYFPNDGHDFLNRLYKRLSEHPTIKTVTFSEAVASEPNPVSLEHLHAGSWINHDFRVWIGHKEDNKAWDLLYDARRILEQSTTKDDNYRTAFKEILIAEGSDWCWWFGDEHHSPDNDLFDQLYRSHLKNVYTLLNLPVPQALSRPIRSSFVLAHLTEPIDFINPIIDGRITHYYEWENAGYFDCRKAGSTMHKADRKLRQIFYGYGRDGSIHIRIDPAAAVDIKKLDFEIDFSVPEGLTVSVKSGKIITNKPVEKAICIIDKILELTIKYAAINGENSSMLVRVLENGIEVEKWPAIDNIPIRPDLAQKQFWAI